MKILLTGATGYIGRRLSYELVKNPDIQLRLFVRNRKKVGIDILDRVEVAEGDTFNIESLKKALEGIDIAYYLIHSMGAGKDFEDLDRTSAENFRDACIKAGVKRIIYLGGLGVKETASKHLLSRIETGEILSSRPHEIQTIWFRAGIIIGSGSASFEIIMNLVQKLPIMVTPKWVKTKSQPIAVDDVLAYLDSARDLEMEGNLTVDIGSNQMSFKEMMLGTGEVLGLRRVLIPVPFLTPSLSSYWLILFTPVNFKIASSLVEGLKSETILQNRNAEKHFPGIRPMDFKDALKKAIQEIDDNLVMSRWCDSSAGNVCDIKPMEQISKNVYIDGRTYGLESTHRENVFKSILLIGGENGWPAYDFLWKIRGFADKIIGGYGKSRGRRDRENLRIGDSLDFWKVADIREGRRLLLSAQMKAPGKAWLEFLVEEGKLVQTAYFYPYGIWGRVYWYLMKPFHYFIFRDMAKNIFERAKKIESG